MFVNSILLTCLWGWFDYYHPILWWENSGTEEPNNLLKIIQPDQGFESRQSCSRIHTLNHYTQSAKAELTYSLSTATTMDSHFKVSTDFMLHMTLASLKRLYYCQKKITKKQMLLKLSSSWSNNFQSTFKTFLEFSYIHKRKTT